MIVITPTTVDEAARALTELRALGSSASIRGHGTWSANEPETSILDTRGMEGVVDHAPDDLTVVVRAGTTLGNLEAVLSAENQTAVLPETSPERTVGGVVASGDSGYRRLRYGPTRDRVLGITMVTGYGETVHGGGRLVKNVTGYDLPRLATGSMGALGLVVEVCLKLWTSKPSTATVAVDDPRRALAALYQPLAILETEEGALAYLEGTEEAVAVSAATISGSAIEGLAWPEPISSSFLVSVRVPAGACPDAVRHVCDAGAQRFIAQHGVGLIEAGFEALDDGALDGLRSAIAALGGVVVVVRWPEGAHVADRWGVEHQAASIARNMKHLFDPAGIMNAGVLPGGI